TGAGSPRSRRARSPRTPSDGITPTPLLVHADYPGFRCSCAVPPRGCRFWHLVWRAPGGYHGLLSGRAGSSVVGGVLFGGGHRNEHIDRHRDPGGGVPGLVDVLTAHVRIPAGPNRSEH